MSVAEDANGQTMSHATSTPTSESALDAHSEEAQLPPMLRLPAELRVRIYELAMPTTATNILLRYDHPKAPAGHRSFEPEAPPPIDHVCRRLCEDGPVHDYYAKNVFILYDHILELSTFDKFVRSSGRLVKAITNVKVNITHNLKAMTAFTGGWFNLSFSLKKRENGAVAVEGYTSEHIEPDYRDPTKLCCCELLQTIKPGSYRGDSVLDILRAVLEGYAAASPVHGDRRPHVCATCGDGVYGERKAAEIAAERRKCDRSAAELQAEASKSVGDVGESRRPGPGEQRTQR